MKSFDNIKFVRWGSLNSQKHKEGRLESNSKERYFHTPPCYNGIYAFPEGIVERFLIGGSYSLYSSQFYFKDDEGNKIDDNEFWDLNSYNSKTGYFKVAPKYRNLVKRRGIKLRDIDSEYVESEEKYYVTYHVRPHRFAYTGELWHHLGEYIDNSKIIDNKGDWHKTTYRDYITALKRCWYKEKFDSYIKYSNRHGNPASYPNIFSKDHYEVFIEHLK